MRALLLGLAGVLIILINTRIRSSDDRPVYERSYATRGVVVGVVLVVVAIGMAIGL